MATLRKRNDKWQAQVRKTGYQPRSKSFTTRADALRWIRDTELELERAVFAYDPAVLERTTVEQMLRRYADEITRFKRGSETEAIRIEAFLREPWASSSLFSHIRADVQSVPRQTPQAG